MAADQLGLSQSAISRSISSLDARTGSTLFEREAGRLRPTQEAVRLNHRRDPLFSALDLFTSPAFIVLKAANHALTFKLDHSSGADHYLKIIGWCWFYLSTVLDDYSRYVISTARQGISQQCPERDGNFVRT